MYVFICVRASSSFSAETDGCTSGSGCTATYTRYLAHNTPSLIQNTYDTRYVIAREGCTLHLLYITTIIIKSELFRQTPSSRGDLFLYRTHRPRPLSQGRHACMHAYRQKKTRLHKESRSLPPHTPDRPINDRPVS